MFGETLDPQAEALWEELGGDLCICQRADVPHWCEACQRRIQRIGEAFQRVADLLRAQPPEAGGDLHTLVALWRDIIKQLLLVDALDYAEGMERCAEELEASIGRAQPPPAPAGPSVAPCVHPIGLTTCGYPEAECMHEGSALPAPIAGRHAYRKPEPFQVEPPPAPDPTPYDYLAVYHEAQAYVRGSVLWRFMEHTPLENDVAVWLSEWHEKGRASVALPAVEGTRPPDPETPR